MIAEFKPRLNGVGIKEYMGQELKIDSCCPDDEDWGDLNWELNYES